MEPLLGTGELGRIIFKRSRRMGIGVDGLIFVWCEDLQVRLDPKRPIVQSPLCKLQQSQPVEDRAGGLLVDHLLAELDSVLGTALHPRSLW